MPSSEIEISVLTTIDAIPAADWDACAIPDCGTGTRPADPFVTHRFLLGLEQSGSVGSGSGWGPPSLGGAFERPGDRRGAALRQGTQPGRICL